MSIGGGASSGQSNSTTQLDPQVKGDWENLYGMAQNTAGQPTPQQSVAGFTPAQLQGQEMAINASQPAEQSLAQAMSTAQGFTGYQAPTVGQNAAGLDTYSAASATAPKSSTIQYSNVDAPQFSASQLQQFENPYTSDVIDTSMNQLDLARQQAINGNSSEATTQGGQGAWNGSRAGVSDALTNQGFGQTAATMIAGLNNTNFQTALGAEENYGQMGEQAQEANQTAGLDKGLAVYGGDLSTALQNAAATNTSRQYDATAGNQQMQFNAAQKTAAQEANASNSIYSQGLDLSALGEQGTLAQADQAAQLEAANAVLGVGQQQQTQAQNLLNTDYSNQMTARNLPLQTMESTFGIIPTTANGSNTVSNSSGKSGQAGIG